MIILLFSGETDWKVLAINVNDPLAQKMNGKPVFAFFSDFVFLYIGTDSDIVTVLSC